MSALKELQNDIVASLFLIPCDFKTLKKRDFLNNYSLLGVERLVQEMIRERILYYRGQAIHANKKWVKKNIAEEYNLEII